MSLPSTAMLPEVRGISRLMRRIRVVLPQPDGPMKTQISPCGTVRLTLSTAGCAAPG